MLQINLNTIPREFKEIVELIKDHMPFYSRIESIPEKREEFCSKQFHRSDITRDATQWLFDNWDDGNNPTMMELQDYLLKVHPRKMTDHEVSVHLEGIEEYYPIYRQIMDQKDEIGRKVPGAFTSSKAKKDVMMWIYERWESGKKVSLGEISDYAFDYHEIKVNKDLFQEYMEDAKNYYDKYKLIRNSAPDTSYFMNLMLLNQSIYNETGIDLFEEYRHSGSKITRKGEPKKRDLLLNPYKNGLIINAMKDFIENHDVWKMFGEESPEIDEKYHELVNISEKLDEEIEFLLETFQKSGPTLFEMAIFLPISIRTLRKFYSDKMSLDEYKDRFPSTGIYGSKFHELISLICSKVFMNEFGDQPIYFSEVKPYPKWANFMIDGIIRIPEKHRNHKIFQNLKQLFPKIPTLKYVNIDYTMDTSDVNSIDKILKYQFPKDQAGGLILVSISISNNTKTLDDHVKKYCNNPESIKLITFTDFIHLLNQNEENLELLNFLKNQPIISALKEKKHNLDKYKASVFGTSKLKSLHDGKLQDIFSGFKQNIFEILNKNRNPNYNNIQDILFQLFKITSYHNTQLSEVKKKLGLNFYKDKYLFKALESKGVIKIEGSGKNKSIKICKNKKVQKFLNRFL